jgi:ribose/xylose/arabinose/galactoside ABC-type transport system permease subunit
MATTAPAVPDSDRRPAGRGAMAVVRIFRSPEWGLVAAILATLAVIYWLDPSHAFFRGYRVQTLFHQVALFGLLAIGATVVIISGGIDLSTGSLVALSSVVGAKLLTDWLQRGGGTAASAPSTGVIVAAIAITLLMGLLIGLFHAFLIAMVRLPPFIATLATMAGLRSVAKIADGNRTVTVRYEAFRFLGDDYRVSLGIFIVTAIAFGILMGNTVLGRHIYAMGGNETAARLSGVRTRRLKFIVYGISGVLSALGGILFAGKNGLGDHTLGVAYELIAITAAVVGGCSLSGGIGSIRGTVLGLLLTQIVIQGTGQVAPAGIDSTTIEGLVLGTVVILAVAFNQLVRTRRE